MSSGRRRGGALLERDVLEIERRLALHRENTPKRIAVELRVHPNTISAINLGRHPVQARFGRTLARAYGGSGSAGERRRP
jgi:hypothetical protein